MTKSYAYTLEELLPMSMEEFLEDYKGKKPFIAKHPENRFSNHFSWRELEIYLNGDGRNGHYGIGQANLYCSSKKDAHCFPIHADSTDNFLFHVSGKVRWFIYNEFQHECKPNEATLAQVVDLDDGDLLYLPKKLYHKVQTLSPRISISFHFNESPHWVKGRPQKRMPWLDYTSGIEEEVARVLKNSS
jgi:ribosomal protein L16 Arg81 hydroxylase